MRSLEKRSNNIMALEIEIMLTPVLIAIDWVQCSV